MGRTRGWLFTSVVASALILVSALLVQSPARAALPFEELTLDGPRRFELVCPDLCQRGFAPPNMYWYKGRLTLAEGIALPDRTVELLIDGVIHYSTTTNINGDYALRGTFGQLKEYRLQAVADRGSDFEVYSPEIAVVPRRVALKTYVWGLGEGLVVSDPAGISCSSACSKFYERYPTPQTITLTAIPSQGSTFLGWSGDCAGTGLECSVTVTEEMEVDAAFGLPWQGNAPVIRGISASVGGSCALTSGVVNCWSVYGAPQQVVPNLEGAISISGFGSTDYSNPSHACALLDVGTVKCWGTNRSAQLGDGSLSDSITPVDVFGAYDAVAVSAKNASSCALLSNGTVACWGSRYTLAIYQGVSSRVFYVDGPPVLVRGVTNAVDVSGDCALLYNGAVRCWYGRGFAGDVGITGAVAFDWDPNHGCAVISDGTVRCWGQNEFGQLGNGTTLPSSTPVEVLGLNDAISVSVSRFHTCALRSGGLISCWGNNEVGQLGDGSNSNSSTPVQVIGMSGATELQSGGRSTWFEHSCARLATTIECWGVGFGPTPVDVNMT